VSDVELAKVLLPHLRDLRVDQVRLNGQQVRIDAATRTSRAACPGCGTVSARPHSRYRRQLADTAAGGRPVLLILTVRRFLCQQPGCVKRTFVEQPAGLTGRHHRHTDLARQVLGHLALALGGRPGARLAERLALPISRMSMLRLIRAIPDPPVATPRVLGVDEFAQRRGHRYATILVDMDTHRPVDVLPGRDADTLADWLRAHPGVEVICRDRGGSYAEGAARGAPHAIQVADRWHLLHNLSEAVKKVVVQHRRCLRATSTPAATTPPCPVAAPQPSAPPPGRRAANTQRRHAAVHELRAKGWAIKAIARHLQLDRKTVRKYARAQSPEQLISPNPPGRHRVIASFMPYLQQRLNDGVTSAEVLLDELRDRGYRGSARTLRRALAELHRHLQTPAPPQVPSARQLTGWIMRPDERLSDDDRLGLKDACTSCPDLATLTALAHGFTNLVRQRAGNTRLQEWISHAAGSTFPELRGFAAGLLRDLDAVVAGVTEAWSSGAVEGTVNRIKTIKRQMYGRAKLDLLRKRILAST
jgi:transposase